MVSDRLSSTSSAVNTNGKLRNIWNHKEWGACAWSSQIFYWCEFVLPQYFVDIIRGLIELFATIWPGAYSSWSIQEASLARSLLATIVEGHFFPFRLEIHLRSCNKDFERKVIPSNSVKPSCIKNLEI
jgi:hypothetical protein